MLLFPNASSHQIFYKVFTRKQFLPTYAGNAQAQLHFQDDQQRAFGISNISNSNNKEINTHIFKLARS